MSDLPRGLYDELLTAHLEELLERTQASSRSGAIDAADAPHLLADHIGRLVARACEGRDLDEQLAVAGQIIELLRAPDASIPAPARRLRAVGSRSETALSSEPEIPLSEHDLLVNARREPQLAPELSKEIASADRIDLIVAFVRWTGVRLVVDSLGAAAARGARVRLLTTTYTGSTERRALDALERRGVEIRISYDTESTRLHAKAWIFHRETGFGTAYVGSSNLTRTALLDGREWNVRLSRRRSPELFEKILGAFEAQWESGDYAAYDPDHDAERLDRALLRGQNPAAAEETSLSGLELRPWPYQEEILEALDVEREVHGSYRNLVVAPTGTGKTVVAALDYKRLCAAHGPLRLLFVAHRETILSQARRTFREAMADGSFGEMLVGGRRPDERQHVFASIQTLTSLGPEAFRPDAFDVVIVDEFHHAEAATYRRWLDHLAPRVLLALTATPERADGLEIRAWTDRRTAFDMRLWHALDRGLLAPFQYFGLADVADLTAVRWSGGRYQAADLERVYTADDARARLIARKVEELVTDPRSMRALGFCATVEHARFMAEAFRRIGWRAASLSANSTQKEREDCIRALRQGELAAIFTRDVFNEGVDIPEVDTILLLRPTESVTVYLQQIGRGLRRRRGKDVCTILDFVGQYRREYRFDLRLSALTGIPRRQLVEAAEAGFPFLPSGCHVKLDRQAQEWIVEHLRHAVRATRSALRNELVLLAAQLPDGDTPTLRRFLEESGLELEDVSAAGGWTLLRRRAALESRPAQANEKRIQSGVTRLVHVDDSERIDAWRAWLSDAAPPALSDERERRLASMLLVSLWGLRTTPATFEAAWNGILASDPLREELDATLELLGERRARITRSLDLSDVPLRLGARYTRDEILAAFGILGPGAPAYSHQAGPWHHPASNTEVLFITLSKSPEHYSPKTLYRDYAISRHLFHWETPHDTYASSTRGRRYLQQRASGLRVLLAVREARSTPWRTTAAYVLLGPCELVSHQGERPIGITWRLATPIPADLYEQFKLAVA